MAGVSDNQADITVSCKVHARLDLFLGLCKNDIISIEAARAGCSRVVGWQASIVGILRPKICDWVVSTDIIVSLVNSVQLVILTSTARWWSKSPVILRTLLGRTH